MSPPVAATQTEEWHDQIRRQTAIELRPSLKSLVDECVVFVQEGMPELALDEELAEGLYQSAYDNLERIFDMLGDGRPVGGTDAPAGAIRYAEIMVRRGTPLAALLRAYRLGTMWFWTLWKREIARRVEDRELFIEAVDHSMSFVFDYVDVVSEQVTAEYTRQREHWARTAAALRHETVSEILAGGRPDLDVAAARLGYDVRGDHRAFVFSAAATDDAEDVVGRLEAQAQALVQLLGPRNALLVPDGRSTLWLWCSFATPLSEAGLAEACAAHRLPPDVTAACGMPGEGRAGFVTSHEEALFVRELMRVSGRQQARVTRYDKVVVSSLMATDLPRARRFVEHELGALAAGDDATRRIRATVMVLLETGQRTATAKRLGIHQNTVHYRAKNAERMLGHPLSERRFEVEAALRLLRTIEA
jgi:DNA-binding PucR family transcriptional regulator